MTTTEKQFNEAINTNETLKDVNQITSYLTTLYPKIKAKTTKINDFSFAIDFSSEQIITFIFRHLLHLHFI